MGANNSFSVSFGCYGGISVFFVFGILLDSVRNIEPSIASTLKDGKDL